MTHEHPAIIISLSARKISFPNVCPCCGTPADTEIPVYRQTSGGGISSFDVPFCTQCENHIKSYPRNWSASAELLLLFVFWPGFLALFVYRFFKRRSAREMCGPNCLSVNDAFQHIGRYRDVHTFAVRSRSYARLFAKANEPKLVNVKRELRALLEEPEVM